MLLRPTETWPVYARDKWATSVARGFPVLVLSLALPVFQPRTTSSWLRAQGRIIFRPAAGVRRPAAAVRRPASAVRRPPSPFERKRPIDSVSLCLVRLRKTSADGRCLGRLHGRPAPQERSEVLVAVKRCQGLRDRCWRTLNRPPGTQGLRRFGSHPPRRAVSPGWHARGESPQLRCQPSYGRLSLRGGRKSQPWIRAGGLHRGCGSNAHPDSCRFPSGECVSGQLRPRP